MTYYIYESSQDTQSTFVPTQSVQTIMNEVNDVDNNKIDLTYEVKLAEQAAQGSKEAFSELYGRYKNKLYRYALYKLCDPQDAEDAVSECVLAAWQGMSGLRSPEAFGAWMFRILSNCCAAHLRNTVSLRENMRELYEAGREPSGSGHTHTETTLELMDALSHLSAEDREIVLLAVVAGLTSREISDITALKPGSVRSRLSRSLSKMRQELS